MRIARQRISESELEFEVERKSNVKWPYLEGNPCYNQGTASWTRVAGKQLNVSGSESDPLHARAEGKMFGIIGCDADDLWQT
jgi:hypothetical protein